MTEATQILRRADNPGGFARALADLSLRFADAHPFWGAFGRVYYPAVFGASRADESFMVFDRTGRPALVALVTCGAESVDHYGNPAALFGPATEAQEPGAELDAALDRIVALAGPDRAARVCDGLRAPPDRPGAVGLACMERGFAALPFERALCDLSLGEAGLRRALRKSYRAIVNQGPKTLRLAFVNAQEPDRERFDAYRAFHRHVAGRETRGRASWDAMFDWVTAGRGELALGYFGVDELVSGTLIVDGMETAYYASGVYERTRFDRPLAHWPLFASILRARDRGLAWFDLGEIVAGPQADPKEAAIAFFKSGFATEKRVSTVWERPAGA